MAIKCFLGISVGLCVFAAVVILKVFTVESPEQDQVYATDYYITPEDLR